MATADKGRLRGWLEELERIERPSASAEELGIHLFPNLRLRNGTDGLEPLAAGYETAVIASCTDLKQPANYHWWHDLAENVDFDTVQDGIALAEAAIRRLDERWL